jgi:hypothetical protein
MCVHYTKTYHPVVVLRVDADQQGRHQPVPRRGRLHGVEPRPRHGGGAYVHLRRGHLAARLAAAGRPRRREREMPRRRDHGVQLRDELGHGYSSTEPTEQARDGPRGRRRGAPDLTVDEGKGNGGMEKGQGLENWCGGEFGWWWRVFIGRGKECLTHRIGVSSSSPYFIFF